MSEEDFEKLRYYLQQIKPKDNIRIVVYKEDETPSDNYIKDINVFIENENKRIEQDKQKAEQEEKKRKEALKQRKIERAKKILEENS